MQTIDHDPNEPPIDRGPGPWRWVVPVVLAVIGLNAYSYGLDWVSFACGGGAGIVLTAWAIEVTGNKVPSSWRSKAPRSGRS